MKKIILGSFSLLVLSFVFFTSPGCKKDTLTDIKIDTITRIDTIIRIDTLYQCAQTMQGLWTGDQINPSGDGQAFSWSIRADGTASYENIVFGTRQLCVGTWTITNGTWTCNVTCIYGASGFVGAKQTYTANYNVTTGVLTNGTYSTATSGAPDTGTFNLTEVK